MKSNCKQIVFQTLNNRLELGGEQELHTIDRVSKTNIDAFINEFRANHAHSIARPFKNSTVNRYVEQWLVKQYNKFNK